MGVSKSFEIWDAKTGRFIPLPPSGGPASGGAPRDLRSCLQFSAASLDGAVSPPPLPAMNQVATGSQPNPSGAVPLGGHLQASPGHLHYGGGQLQSSSSRSGTSYKNGSKPAQGSTFRTQKRMEMIVRLENATIPDHAIAQMLCITPVRLYQIKKSTTYLQVRQRITLGLVVDQDATLADIKARRKEVLTSMLPTALQVIANAIHNTDSNINAQKLRVATAQDLLDREGTFAKISRAEIKPVDSFDWEKADQDGRSIFDVLRGSQRQTVSLTAKREIEDTIELSRTFSNSKTLDSTQQQAALEELEREVLTALPSITERIQ